MSKQNISLEHSQDILDNADLLFSTEQVEEAISSMATAITEQLHGSNPVILPVMIGGVILAGKLISQLNFPLQVDYIHATRYRNPLKSADFTGLIVPDRYVFGYGMDYHEYHRNLDGIYALKQ